MPSRRKNDFRRANIKKRDGLHVAFLPTLWLDALMPSPTVLVVDDHPDTCEITVKILKRLGYPAHCALSGREALDFAASNPVGLILLDLMMPVMDGIETLARLESDPALKSIPVVMHSALSGDLLRTQALAGGAKDFLVKGNISLERLQAVLEAHLRQRA